MHIQSILMFASPGRALNNHHYTLSHLGEIPSPGRVAPSLKATPSPRLNEEPLNHVISHRDLAQANVSRLSETESLKTPILLAWARYRAQKRSSFLAASLRRVVPRLSETKSLNTKPRSPRRAAQPKPDVRFCNSRLDEPTRTQPVPCPSCVQSPSTSQTPIGLSPSSPNITPHAYTIYPYGEIPSPGRVAPSLKATPSPRLNEEPLNHVISHRDLAQANVSRLSETESLKTPILLAWARYRAQKRSSFLAASLRRVVPRLSETKSLNTKPRSPRRAAQPKPDVRFCNSRLDEHIEYEN
ncbi:hypothetical protein DEO72_LG5g2546 [Vigna unguiculata]|uniref:Uncharacterized protein n=1 Tax=Vigna unguiculata TaxID=3917 RepID=A0A4D6M013_VIGUN|nr:hypothetical protein DEO72_LG5g2546 [Vigna unguiculata]